jgi:nitrous oxidase accessory protein NosD
VKLHIGRRATLGAVGVVTLLLLGGPTIAVMDPATEASVATVEIAETITYGGTDVDLRRAAAEGFAIPMVTVAFTQYPYVVSYVGPATASREVGAPATVRQFGAPGAMQTTDFSDVTPTVDAEGYLRIPPGRDPGRTEARSATYVVDSRARIASGPVALGFAEATDAAAFAQAHGGQVVGFDELGRTAPAPDRERLFEAAIGMRSGWADTVGQRDRADADPTIVGDRHPTLAAAIEAAPPGGRVVLPAGTYAVETIEVDKPLTITGAGTETVLLGDGHGSPVVIRAPDVTIRNLQIRGVGSVGARPPEEGDWDTSIQLAYGGGDAGIVVDGAPRAKIEDVTIETPASGIIGRDATELLIRHVDIAGANSAAEGFMGVIVIGAPALIEEASISGGRDGVYTHRADGTVIRGSTLTVHRYGTHLMYTSDALVAGNSISGGDAGVMIMTRPVGNLVIGNKITDTTYGIVPAGGEAYIADNTITRSGYGIQIAGDRHLVTRNRVVNNTVGLRANEIFPTNTVIRNDIIDNDRPAVASLGPLRTWTSGGVGNYWGPLPAIDRDADGSYERAYRPTAPRDRRVVSDPAAVVVTEAPVVQLTRAAESSIGGLRGPGVIDTAPATDPFTSPAET